MAPIQINGIIVDAIALTRSAADVANVRVKTDLQAEMPFVRGDSVQLQQVCFNLLANGDGDVRNDERFGYPDDRLDI